MQKEKILVTGALGQIGTELVPALQAKYGKDAIIATDIRPSYLDGHYEKLDVSNSAVLNRAIARIQPTQIYHLAAILSASGESDPLATWDINMQSLLHILEAARKLDACRVFWPSSIAVFGQHIPTDLCPQHAPQQPTTVYGISKSAGEMWCQYYFEKYGLDVRSIRYPGLISHSATPGGGTTDYAVAIFHEAIDQGKYTSFLKADTLLPMLYMPDAIRATLEIMDASAKQLSVRTSYNIGGLTFHPDELAAQIRRYLPDFTIHYQPDFRQGIAESWPTSVNGQQSTIDWNWEHRYNLQQMVADMLWHLGGPKLKLRVNALRPKWDGSPSKRKEKDPI